MNELQWHNSTEPEPMLQHLKDVLSIRKARLFSLACCRRIWDWIVDERSRCALALVEEILDALATDFLVPNEVAESAYQTIKQNALFTILGPRAVACNVPETEESSSSIDPQMLQEAQSRVDDDPYVRAAAAVWSATTLISSLKESDSTEADVGRIVAFQAVMVVEDQKSERIAQASVLRDVIGDPFRPITIDPRWETSNVRALAESIYVQRAYENLPILADALMDGGCDNDAILTHCRQQQEHVRGCWVLDLLLGKT